MTAFIGKENHQPYTLNTTKKKILVAFFVREFPWLFSNPLSRLRLSVSMVLLWHCQKSSADYICFLKLSWVLWIHHSQQSSTDSSCQLGCELCEWCLPSGATHAGEYILPGHWKENLTSAMLILAVISSSICGNRRNALPYSGVLCFQASQCSSIRSCVFWVQKYVLKSIVYLIFTITLLLLR